MIIIELSKGFFASIDDCDRELVCRHKWSAKIGHGTIYAYRAVPKAIGSKGKIMLHRQILGVTDPNVFIDHIDGNGLNNQRDNLRIVTRSQNQMNSRKSTIGKSSKHKGVHYDKTRDKWCAEIMFGGKRIRGKRYSTEKEAAESYNEMAKNAHGEYAALNSI